ncbi:putative transporter domain protein [Mycobacterium xenopi 3993]|nr:putative transporter domain protein [Mycobacterium xenopi 3993]
MISGSTDKFTKSAGFPSTTPRDWSPDAPYEVMTCTPLPCSDALNAGITLLHPGSGAE